MAEYSEWYMECKIPEKPTIEEITSLKSSLEQRKEYISKLPAQERFKIYKEELKKVWIKITQEILPKNPNSKIVFLLPDRHWSPEVENRKIQVLRNLFWTNNVAIEWYIEWDSSFNWEEDLIPWLIKESKAWKINLFWLENSELKKEALLSIRFSDDYIYKLYLNDSLNINLDDKIKSDIQRILQDINIKGVKDILNSHIFKNFWEILINNMDFLVKQIYLNPWKNITSEFIQKLKKAFLEELIKLISGQWNLNKEDLILLEWEITMSLYTSQNLQLIKTLERNFEDFSLHLEEERKAYGLEDDNKFRSFLKDLIKNNYKQYKDYISSSSKSSDDESFINYLLVTKRSNFAEQKIRELTQNQITWLNWDLIVMFWQWHQEEILWWLEKKSDLWAMVLWTVEN